MPTWKKIVVSGSNLSQLVNDANYLIDGQSAASLSGSFSGSFFGDGSNITNVTATSIEFANVQNKPTLVSGSSQITISNVDGYTAFSQSIDDHLDAKVTDLSGDIDSLSGSAHTQRAAISGAFASTQATQDGRLNSLENFTASLNDTFATDAELNSATASVKTYTDTEVSGLSGSAHTQRVAIETSLQSNIDSAISTANSELNTSSSALTSAYQSADTALSSSAHTQRVAIETSLQTNIDGAISTANSELNASSSALISAYQSADTALSSSAHTQRVAIETSLDGKINTEKGRIDAILTASSADKDSFAEIVALINSVDTTNDQAFAAFYTASNNRLDSLETDSGSQDTRITALESFSSSLDSTFATNVELSDLSSSAHTQRTAIESGLSSDIDSLSGSAHTQRVAIESGLSSDISSLSGSAHTDRGAKVAALSGSAHTQRVAIETGLSSDISSLSGSAHTQRTAISGALASTISNLSQTLSISGSTGDVEIDLKTQDLTIAGDGGGISTSITGTTVSLVSNGVVSGSSQVTISDTTGYTAFSQSIDTHLDAKVSDLTADISSLSGSAHTQRVAIETSLDGKINTEKGRIDAILTASSADKDSFAEIVALINSVDTSNDQAFAAFYTASNDKFSALENTSGSHDTRITALESFSSSLDSTFATEGEVTAAVGALSGSAHTQRVAIESGLSSNIDTLSGSAHTQRTAISGAFATTISNLSQTLSISGSTGDVDVDLKSQDLTIAGDGGGISTSISGTTISLVSNGVVSGSSQVTISDTTGYTAFSQSIDTHLDAKVSDLAGDISSLSGSAHTQRVAIESGLSSGINTLSGSAHTQRVALDSAQSSAVSSLSGSAHTDRVAKVAALSGSAHTQRVALDSAQSSAVSSLSGSAHTDRIAKVSALSGSAHTQRVAIETSLDGKITTEKNRINAILSASVADYDTFAEIVTLINSVDTTNDTVFAGFVTSSNSRATAIESAATTLAGRVTTNEGDISTNAGNITSLSGSAHTQRAALASGLSTDISNLSGSAHTKRVADAAVAAGLVSSLSGSSATAIRAEYVAADTALSSSFATTISNLTNDYTELINIPAGIVSSSAQTVANLVGEDVVANSFTGDGSGLTNITISQAATVSSAFSNVSTTTVTHNFDSRNVNIVVYNENFEQIIPASVTLTTTDSATVTFSTATSGTVVVAKGGHIVSGSVDASSISGLDQAINTYLDLDGVVSSSVQVDITSTTGYTAFSQSIDTHLDANITALSSSVDAHLDANITALSSSAHTQRGAIQTALQTNIDSAISTANSELNASSSALTTAYRSELNASSSALTSAYQGADTALSSSIATTIASLSSTLTISGSTGDDTVNLVSDSLSVVGTAGEIETTVTNNQIQIGIVDNPTLTGNVIVTGNLTVTGDTIQAQVANLEIEDRFILLNSGSNTGDAGIIFGGSDGTANIGSGIFWDSPANVFGFAQGISSTDATSTHQSKLGNIEVSAGAPSGAPLFQGVGTIFVDSSTGDVLIYS